MTHDQLAAAAAAAIAAGEITRREAELALGFALLEGATSSTSYSTFYRRVATLRKLGADVARYVAPGGPAPAAGF